MNAAYQTEQKKLIVIANCHCLPLADILSLSVQGVQTDFIDVNFVNQPHMVEKVDALSHLADHDFVFSFNLSDQFPTITTSVLRELLNTRLVVFSNIHFSGLHPDITYLGAMGKRVTGLFGDYHSKIVLVNFLAGKSTDECLKSFNAKNYESLGYFHAFDTASSELLRRDENCDVRFADQFLAMIKRQHCLHTINHPTGAVFYELSEALSKYAGLDFIKYGQGMMQNHLASNYTWPIYNEIAEYHNLSYRTPPYFVRPNQRMSRSISYKEFVDESYVAYSRLEPSELLEVVKNQPYYAHALETLS